MESIEFGIFGLIALFLSAVCVLLAMRYPVVVPAALTTVHLGLGAFGISIPYRGEAFLGIALLLGVTLRSAEQLPRALNKVWAIGLLALFATISYLLSSGQLSFAVAQVCRGLISVLWEVFCLCVFCHIIPLKRLGHFWNEFELVAASSAILVSATLLYGISHGTQSFDLNVLRLGFGNSHPATLGYLSAIVSLILAHAVSSGRTGKTTVREALLWTGLVCGVANLYLSQTRGAWVGFGLGFAVEAIISRRWLKSAVFAGVLGIGLLVPSTTARFTTEFADVEISRPETWLNAGSGRSFFWGHIFRTAQTVPPIWGGGLGTAIQSTTLNRELLGYFANSEYVLVHNDVLMFYTDLGIVGMLLYCVAFLRPLLRRHSPLLASLAPCVVVGALFDNFVLMIVPLEYLLISAVVLSRLKPCNPKTASLEAHYREYFVYSEYNLLSERPAEGVSVCMARGPLKRTTTLSGVKWR